jgi:hypothetical protein
MVFQSHSKKFALERGADESIARAPSQREELFMNRSRLLSVLFAGTLIVGLFMVPETAEAKTWNWKRYRLRMWLPAGMKVTRNNAQYFIAKGRGLVLKVKPWKSAGGTSVSAARYGVNSYKIIKSKRVTWKKRIRTPGAFSYAMLGDGIVEGRRAYFAVIGLSGKGTRNKFYVRMWWRPASHSWAKRHVVRIAERLVMY